MTAKKSIKITELVESTNHMLANHQDCNIGGIEYGRSFRLGACSLIEHVLHKTGNYHGYMYLSANDMPINAKPGIIRGEPNEYPDESRRLYCVR